MSHSIDEIAGYRISKANETLQEAKLLCDNDHWNTAASRLYYACFYAASAYLTMSNINASTHKGIKMAFNRELIRSKILKYKFGHMYNDLFNLRLQADYRDFKIVTKQTITPLFEPVNELVQEIEALIDERMTDLGEWIF